MTRRTPAKVKQLSEFETLCATEKVATQRALNRCCGLADRIKNDVFLSLADFLASLKCAASVLEEIESNPAKK